MAPPLGRRAKAAVVLLLAATLPALSAPHIHSGALATAMPAGVPGPLEKPDWEVVEGEIVFGDKTILYRFLVNPAYEGLYQVTQYRMWKTDATAGETEKVLYNAHPGQRVPLEVYELVDGRWLRIGPGTPEFHREMIHAIRVYDLHRQASDIGGF
jgi:hypothetical protein